MIEKFLVFLSVILVIILFPFSLACIFISVRQFERIVILRNGKILDNRCYGPGLICYLPCIDNIKYIDLRIMCHTLPPEECLTKDSLTLTVQAVVYYRVVDPLWSIINVADFNMSTKYLAATALRNTIGRHRLSELLVNRAEICSEVLEAMKPLTTKWGVFVIRIEMNNISIPLQLKQAMATEAVSLRLSNAKIMVAQAEIESTKSLEKATSMLMDNPLGMQLRYLQSLQSIAGDKTHTIVVPYSKDMLRSLFGNK
ncbi:band 7 protein AGAP004871-like [Cydia strobilella]|uniref:band 7 protein AGAP004871-like n=1 Tax=Cydia strobilella TaxID=1100964 RepID=UPI003006D0E8